MWQRRTLSDAQSGGYARACRRGRRPRSAIIGGMLEAERHQHGHGSPDLPHRGRAGRFMGGLSPVLCSLMVTDVSPWRLSQWIAGSSRARDLALWFSVPRTPLMTTCSPYSKVASPLGDPMSCMG